MLLVLLALIPGILGENLNCNGFTEIDFAHGPVSVPASGAIAQIAYGVSQNCTWKLSIPAGKYASLKLTSQIPNDGIFMIYNSARTYFHKYSFAGTSDLPAALNSTFSLPPDAHGIFIQLATKGSATGFFSFTAQLHNLPIMPKIIQNVTSPIMINLAKLTQTMYTFEGVKASMFLFRLAAIAPDFRYDNCFVFNGADMNKAIFLFGLAGQVEGIPDRWLGPCTVFCLGNDFDKTAQLLVAPPPASMNEQSSWTIRTGDKINVQLKALQDVYGEYPYPSYLTTYCPGGCDEYLETTSDIPSKSLLTLYSGNPADKLIELESFPIASEATYCPQRLSGVWKTYKVDNNPSAYLTIDRDINGGWQVAKEGRKGFFATRYYGQLSIQQSTTAVFAPSSKRMLTFKCTVLDFNSTSDYVKMTVDQGSGNLKTTQITSSNQTVEIVKGYSLKLEYVQASPISVGALFQFEMTSSTGALAIILPLASLLFLFV